MLRMFRHTPEVIRAHLFPDTDIVIDFTALPAFVCVKK